MRDLLNLAIVLGTPVLCLWLIFSRRPGTKILCLLGRHDFQIAHSHPDGKLGYCIHECTGCSKAVVSDPSLGGSYPIINTQTAIERDASKAALRSESTEKSMQIKVREGEVFPLNRSQQVWWGDSPEVMQVARFAGQEMIASTDDAGAFELDYLGHIGSGFASIEDAKAAAPEFARAVLERLRNRIQGE